MESPQKLLLKKISIKIKKFNIQEIQRLVKFLHLNLEWTDVVNLVSECRMRLTVTNIVSIVNHYLKDSKKIEETYHRVLLVDAIFHDSSNWYTVSIDKMNKHLLDKEGIRYNIQVVLDRLKINAITYVMKCKKLFWVLINIKNTKKKNSQEFDKQYFFTILPGKVFHVFYRPQIIDRRVLNIVIKSIGANKSKPYALYGKHLQSLVNLLEDKDNEQDNLQLLTSNYKEEDVRGYIKQLFGEKQCIINQFTINVESDMSVFSNTNPVGEMCKTKVQLTSDSVFDSVKDMMLSGVIQPPYPDWVSKLPVLGKNTVNVNIHL